MVIPVNMNISFSLSSQNKTGLHKSNYPIADSRYTGNKVASSFLQTFDSNTRLLDYLVQETASPGNIQFASANHNFFSTYKFEPSLSSNLYFVKLSRQNFHNCLRVIFPPLSHIYLKLL